jgi:PAS domain S-box-containing protein
MEALFAFSRTLVGAAGVGEIAQALFRTIDDLFGVDRCVLLAVSEDQTRATGVAAMGAPDAEVAMVSINLGEDQSAVSRVVRERVAHRVLDGQRETLQHRELAERLGIRSALYVPLQTSGGVIAVAVVATSDRVHAFRKDEVDLIQALANDAAVAIERARFAQALREVGERELIVAGIARSVRESLDAGEVLEVAARELGEQTDADRVTVALTEREQLDAIVRTWSVTEGVSAPEFTADSIGSGADLALRDRQTVQSRGGCELCIPLVHRDDLLGVVTVEREGGSFFATETALIELIAIEVAAALGHVRLYQSSKQYLDEQLALSRAAQSLTADLRFDRVLEHIVNEVVKVLRTTSAAFYVYDRDQRQLTLSAAFGEHEESIVGLTTGLVGLAGRVVLAGVSQHTNDYQSDIGSEIHPSFEDVTRAVAAPVRWQGDLRGVITVAARDVKRVFTDRDVELLESFADLASLALHNAEAYRAHSRQARIQAGFYRISQILSASLARGETLSALAQAATEALDGDWSLVVSGDTHGDGLQVESEFNVEPATLSELRDSLVLAEGPAPIAIDHRRTVTTARLSEDERLGERWQNLLRDAGVSSHLAVPVSAHGHQTAVVIVCFKRTTRFGDEELVVANNLGSAASAALERAGLFENERRTRRLNQVLAEVSGLLAETLKTQHVLERIVGQAAVLLEVDACSLAVSRNPNSKSSGPLTDADLRLEVHASHGEDDALVASLETSPPSELVEEVARTGQPLSVPELASETSGSALATERYDGFLGVPLRHPRGHLIGVLSVYSRRLRRWDEAEIAALDSFAHSAAIAIRNAELYASIKQERDTIEKLLASIAEGIAATDASGRVMLWNTAAEQITGVTREQAIGRPWRDVLGISAEAHVTEGGQSVIEGSPSGAPMWVAITASRLREQEGTGAGSIYAFRDVSAHHALDQLKSEFVSTVSYVLRTPLASIYGFSQTLLREDLELSDDDRDTFLRYIVSETERLTSIVDDLLQVTSIDAGAVEVHVDRCDIRPMIDAIGLRAQGTSELHSIVIRGDGPVVARADAEKLQRVLEGLVENAIRFSPDGGDVRIEAQRDNGTVQISVSDSGLGIAAGELKHLFTKFYVAPQTTRFAGPGLGLYISKGLVTAMGGRIAVSSQPGTGSTFTIELPADHGEEGTAG